MSAETLFTAGALRQAARAGEYSALGDEELAQKMSIAARSEAFEEAAAFEADLAAKVQRIEARAREISATQLEAMAATFDKLAGDPPDYEVAQSNWYTYSNKALTLRLAAATVRKGEI